MKHFFQTISGVVFILVLSLSFASNDTREKNIDVQVALDNVLQQDVKSDEFDKPVQMTITIRTVQGDSVKTQVREITLNTEDNEIDLENILKDLNLDIDDMQGESRCIIKLSGDTDELENLDLDLDDLDMGSNIMIIELDDETDEHTQKDNCPMHDEQRMKNRMNPSKFSCQSMGKVKSGVDDRGDDTDLMLFFGQDGQDNGSSGSKGCNMQMRSGEPSKACCKGHDDRRMGPPGFTWSEERTSPRTQAFQYGMMNPDGPGCSMSENMEKCRENTDAEDGCRSGRMKHQMGPMGRSPFHGGPMGGFGVDLNVLDFDFAGINSFITAFGFTPITNNGASFIGVRGQHVIGRGWFIGGLGAGYSTTQNIKGATYSRHLSIQSGYGGVTLTRRYPLRPFLHFEGSVMLGGGNTDIEISDVRENPTFEDPFSNFGNIDYLKFERLFFVYRPEASLIMKINPMLGIRAAVSYLGTYGGDWKTVPFGYTVEGNSPDVPDGTNFSLGLWIGR